MPIPRPPLNQQLIGTRTLFDIGSGEGAGLAALSEDLTINGQTVTNTFRYEGKNATTGLWTATTGENLTGAGSGGTVGLDTPLPGTTDEAANGGGTRYWESSGGSFGDVAAEDMVLELVFKTTTATQYVISKRDGTPDGYALQESVTVGTRLLLYGDSGSATITAPGTVTRDVWVHVIFFIDKSGSGVAYTNGDAGSATSVSSIGSLANSAKLTLAGLSGGTSLYSSNVAYAAMWKQADWLDTHLQATVAQERFHKLTGVYSSKYGGPTHTSLRNSVAVLEKQGNVGYQRLFTVGARWPRIETRPDKHNRYASGLLVESAHTNLCLRSEEFDAASWLKTRCSITANSVTAPDGETTADTLVEDGTASNDHFMYDDFAQSASTVYMLSCYLKPANRHWARLRLYSPTDGEAYANFNVSEGRKGTESNTDNSGIRYIGDGWCHCWITDTRTTAETCYQSIWAGESDSSFVFDGLSQDSLYVWGAMVVAAKYPVSYIKTEGSTVARLAELFEYAVTQQPPYAIVADTLQKANALDGSHYVFQHWDGTLDNRSIATHAADKPRMVGEADNVVNLDATAATAVVDNEWTEHRFIHATNNGAIYLNGVLDAQDTDVAALPTGMDELFIGSYPTTSQLNGHIRLRLLSKPDATKDLTDFGDIMAKASGYISATSATAQSTSYVNVGGTFTSVDLSDFTLSAAGVLTYTGTDTKRFVVSAACSGSISSGTPNVTTTIEKNGAEVASSNSQRDVGGSGIGAWAVLADVELATNDTINLATKVDSGTPNLTMEALSIVVHEF